MSTNDFDQTTPLPVGDDETKPLPSFADAPIENQKTSAEANTSTEAEAPDTSAKDEAPAPDTSAAWTGGQGRRLTLPQPRNTLLSRKIPRLFLPPTCGQPRT